MVDVDPNAPRLDQLGRMIRKQLELQVGAYTQGQHADVQRQYGDPRALTGDDRADFITWNVVALTDELHEALNEVKWKPWLTDGSRGLVVDRDAFVLEMVDAWHFFMNLLLAASPGWEPEEIAAHFAAAYDAKHAVNMKRQRDGYSGVKDANGRALDEPTLEERVGSVDAAIAQTRAVADEHQRRQAENARQREGGADYAT